MCRDKGHPFRTTVFLFGRIPGGVSVLAKGTPPPCLGPGCSGRLGWSGEWELGASSSQLVACLDLPKVFVFLHFLICEMGLIILGEGELRGFVWIHKRTLRKRFEDVKLSTGLSLHVVRGVPIFYLWFACCHQESKASSSGAGCGVSGCTCLVLDEVFIFSEKITTCFLRSDTRPSTGVLVCFFPPVCKGREAGRGTMNENICV